MRNMKDSGVEWIGEIPEEWETWRIKHLAFANLQYGANETGIEYDENLPRYIRITDISQDNKLKDEEKLSLNCDNSENYILNDGDILFARSGATAGKSFYYSQDYGKACFAGYLIRLTVNAAIINSRLIYYYTLTSAYEKWIEQTYIQATIQNVSAEKYNNLNIVLPKNKEEQISIIRYLDKKCAEIDSVIMAKETTNSKLKEYRQSVIYEAVTKGLDKNVPMIDSGIEWIGEMPVGWRNIKIKYSGMYRSGNSITSLSINEEGQFPVYGGNGIRGYIDEITHCGEYVLIGRQGALCGNVQYVDGQFWASEHAIVGSIYSYFSVKFIYYCLLSMNLNQYSESAAQPGLSVDRIVNLRIVCPKKIESQQHIAEYLDKKCAEIDLVISANETTIQRLKEYRQSVIYEVVTGKIEI